ncbi:hypothetical protein ACOSQ3_029826 [Xanthoceras sorbifolium]
MIISLTKSSRHEGLSLSTVPGYWSSFLCLSLPLSASLCAVSLRPLAHRSSSRFSCSHAVRPRGSVDRASSRRFSRSSFCCPCVELQDWNNRRQFTPPSDFHADGVNEFFNSQAVTDGSRANEILKQAPFLLPFTSRVKIFHASRYGNDFIVVK